MPLIVDEANLINIFFVFGEGVFLDSLDVELDCSFDYILEMTRESFLGLFWYEKPDGPGDGHDEQVENDWSVPIIQLFISKNFHIIIILFGVVALN